MSKTYWKKEELPKEEYRYWDLFFEYQYIIKKEDTHTDFRIRAVKDDKEVIASKFFLNEKNEIKILENIKEKIDDIEDFLYEERQPNPIISLEDIEDTIQQFGHETKFTRITSED